VIEHQVGVHVGAHTPAKQPRQQAAARWCVAGDRDAAPKRPPELRRNIQFLSEQCTGARDRLMGMDAAPYILAGAKHASVQTGLDGRISIALDYAQVRQLQDAYVGRTHREIVGCRRRDRDVSIVDTKGYVASRAREVASTGEFETEVDDDLTFLSVLHGTDTSGGFKRR